MYKRMIIMLVAVGLLAAAVYGFEQMRTKGIAEAIGGMQKQSPVVATVTATSQSWQPSTQAVGSLRAINGADLSLDVAGVVDQINFNSGDEVKAGAVLLRLRGEDDPAKLAALQATERLAEITFARDQKQLKAQAVSQAVVDADEANLKNAQAQVAQQQALMEKKVLRAPFDGRLGIRQVDLGQFLAAGTAIVTLQQLDPIYIDFHLPEQTLAATRVGQKVTVAVDAFPDRSFDGVVIAMDPKVDSASRNLMLRAKLDNHDHQLLPGMYGKVTVDQGDAVNYVTLPASAIAFNPYGSTVFTVEDKGKDGMIVHQGFVTTGDTRGDQVAIIKGVKAGDVVVNAGQAKLRNGIAVKINNSVLPTNDPAPKIIDK